MGLQDHGQRDEAVIQQSVVSGR